MTVFARITAVVGRDPHRALKKLHEANQKLHALRSEAAAKKAELASLKAQFWGGDSSNFTHERKIQLAEMIENRRRELIQRGEKPTEAALDSYARSSVGYRNWIELQHRRREDMYRLEAELAQVEADAEAAEGDQELARQAIRLMEEAIRFARNEPQA